MKVEKFKVLLYLKKSGLDKSGKAPIMGRITVNRTMAQFSCKLSCTPGLWNPRESRLNGKSREAVETNAKIDKLLLDINAAFDSLLERKGEFDATSVKDAFQGDYTYRTMREFIETKFKTKDLAFGQLTEQFIHDYENFILDEKGYAVDTVRHYLAILKKTCKRAYQEGHSERFMFQHYVLPKQTVKTPKALSRESFEKIRDVEIAPHRTTHRLARDLFLFACYTGVAYSDAVTVTRENLYTGEDGKLWLKYRRKKNELRASVKLLPEAVALIEKYHDESRDTLFPMIHYPSMRNHMKALAVLAGIKENLCYHVGRHSFASLVTLEAGVPIETISSMLGHSNIQTTQVYARVTPKKLFEDMDKLIEATGDLKLVL